MKIDQKCPGSFGAGLFFTLIGFALIAPVLLVDFLSVWEKAVYALFSVVVFASWGRLIDSIGEGGSGREWRITLGSLGVFAALNVMVWKDPLHLLDSVNGSYRFLICAIGTILILEGVARATTHRGLLSWMSWMKEPAWADAPSHLDLECGDCRTKYVLGKNATIFMPELANPFSVVISLGPRTDLVRLLEQGRTPNPVEMASFLHIREAKRFDLTRRWRCGSCEAINEYPSEYPSNEEGPTILSLVFFVLSLPCFMVMIWWKPWGEYGFWAKFAMSAAAFVAAIAIGPLIGVWCRGWTDDDLRYVTKVATGHTGGFVEGVLDYFDSEVPGGDGVCSDDECPCDNVTIPRGTGYLYISEELVQFRRQYPKESDAETAIRNQLQAINDGIGFMGMGGLFRTGPILVCMRGAKRRKLDLRVAAADATHWWRTGKVPLRPTPLGKKGRPLAARQGDAERVLASSDVVDELAAICLRQDILSSEEGDLLTSISHRIHQEGPAGSLALADLLKELRDCRSLEICRALAVAKSVTPTLALLRVIASIRKVKPLVARRSGMRFPSQIFSADGRIGWDDLTFDRVRAYADSVIDELKRSESDSASDVEQTRGFRKKLKCGACGHTQGEGDWEKAMDIQAKAGGSRGFVNLSAAPQCLTCGSTDLRDLSEFRTEPEPDPDPRIEKWCQELHAASDRYYAGQQGPGEAKMKRIGRTINAQGGEELMAQVYWEIKHPSTQRNVNGCWDGIGTWSFPKYD